MPDEIILTGEEKPNKLVIPELTPEERMLRWLATEHLPPELSEIVTKYRELADYFVNKIRSGPERTVALRKLVESKDCMVRAYIESK